MTISKERVFELFVKRIRVSKRINEDGEGVVYKTLLTYQTTMPPKSALLDKWKKYGFVKNISYEAIPNDPNDHPFRDMYVYFELTDEFITRYTYDEL